MESYFYFFNIFLTFLFYIKFITYYTKIDFDFVGDQWLVSCLGILFSLKNLFYRVVPADQNLENCCGVFRFRLWWCGEWVEVLVDDRLPTINGKLSFLQPQKSNCFWSALLEKAIAKYDVTI